MGPIAQKEETYTDYGTVASHAYCLGCFDLYHMGDMFHIFTFSYKRQIAWDGLSLSTYFCQFRTCKDMDKSTSIDRSNKIALSSLIGNHKSLISWILILLRIKACANGWSTCVQFLETQVSGSISYTAKNEHYLVLFYGTNERNTQFSKSFLFALITMDF